MNTTWKFQHEDSDQLHRGYPTDARGLRLRERCGYTHVHMGTVSGWLQIHVAIRKLEMQESLQRLIGRAGTRERVRSGDAVFGGGEVR